MREVDVRAGPIGVRGNRAGQGSIRAVFSTLAGQPAQTGGPA
jgi:hypothetical protein